MNATYNWLDGDEFENIIKQYWTQAYGDRRQEIVIIGLKDQMDQKTIRRKLDECLVKDYLSAPDNFLKSTDPFPQWLLEAT